MSTIAPGAHGLSVLVFAHGSGNSDGLHLNLIRRHGHYFVDSIVAIVGGTEGPFRGAVTLQNITVAEAMDPDFFEEFCRNQNFPLD